MSTPWTDKLKLDILREIADNFREISDNDAFSRFQMACILDDVLDELMTPEEIRRALTRSRTNA